MLNRFVSSTGIGNYSDSSGIDAPMSFSTAIAQSRSGDYVWIKNDGPYVRTLNETISGIGHLNAPIIFEGYTNTTGDGYLGHDRNENYLCLKTDNFPAIIYSGATARLTVSQRNVYLRYLYFTGQCTSTISLMTFSNANCSIRSSRLINHPTITTTTHVVLTFQTSASSVIDCDLAQYGNHNGTIVSCTAVARISKNRFFGPAGRSAISAGSTIPIEGNLFYDHTGVAINSSSTTVGNVPFVINNTFYECRNGVLEMISGCLGTPYFLNNLVVCQSPRRTSMTIFTGSLIVEGNCFLTNTGIFDRFNDSVFYYNNYSGDFADCFVDTGNNNYILRQDAPFYDSGAPYQDLRLAPPGLPLRSGIGYIPTPITYTPGRITNVSRIIY